MEAQEKKKNFTLCVNDSEVKYYSKQDEKHLVYALDDYYDITVEWTGLHYC